MILKPKKSYKYHTADPDFMSLGRYDYAYHGMAQRCLKSTVELHSILQRVDLVFDDEECSQLRCRLHSDFFALWSDRKSVV